MGRPLGICNSLSITRTLGDSMSETNNTAPARNTAKQFRGQSAAAPSPFPTIADYAFLSNCHTGALVAPDGAIDWLCVPRFDAPSMFGSLLDREAGRFRFGPFGINYPTTRIYEPGTNVLATTWKSPSGWILVHDALTISPRDHEDKITPHTRPPADYDADHLLVRTVHCLEGRVEPASPSSTTGTRRRNGAQSTASAMRPMPAARVKRSVSTPIWLWASRVAAFGRATSWSGAAERIAHSPGRKGSWHRRTPTRPRHESRPRFGTGVPGSAEPAFQTTAIASRSSAQRSPSKD